MAKTIFIVAPKLEELPATTTGWIATASTEQLTGESTGLASALLDGNLATIWHSRYSPLPRSSYPHWLNFDMVQPVYVTKVAIAARQNNANGFTKFKLEGTLDGTNWIVLGDNLVFDPALKSFQEYPITKQYLKQIRATLLEGKTDLCFLAEFTIYRY
ncbi:O-GlcNAcase NagJ precursor [compost metagenome]